VPPRWTQGDPVLLQATDKVEEDCLHNTVVRPLGCGAAVRRDEDLEDAYISPETREVLARFGEPSSTTR
jgi:hypothetical protein